MASWHTSQLRTHQYYQLDNPDLFQPNLIWNMEELFGRNGSDFSLTTLVHEMQGTLKRNTISLDTKSEEQAISQPTRKNRRPQKGTYTFDAWRLVKK